MSKKTAVVEKAIQISAPNMQIAEFDIVGTMPYVQHRFFKKAEIMLKMMEGSKAKSKKIREPRNFEKDYEEAKHKFSDGSCGIPAPAFRNAMVDACRLVGFKMTHAKLAVFIESDGLDQEGAPLVRIKGKPEMHTGYVRNETGVIDIRARPMWKEWSALVRVRFDADQFSFQDIANLMNRVGSQVGIGEGRPNSKKSFGTGWGLFSIQQEKKKKAA